MHDKENPLQIYRLQIIQHPPRWKLSY